MIKLLQITIVTIILTPLLSAGCSADDPIDDIYTQDVLPGNTGDYDVGSEELNTLKANK